MGEGETVTAQVPAAGSVIPGESTVILSIWAARSRRRRGTCPTSPG